MNPGGLRAGHGGQRGWLPATLTYKQAAVVQPFANTLVNMGLTGAQIKTALEQQWQRDASGNVPSRPFLRLGTSKGFEYTYDPSRAEGYRSPACGSTAWPIDATTSYSVTVNSFLASGGDNFRAFAQGTQQARHRQGRPAGDGRLHGRVRQPAEGDAPLAVDFTQRSVGVDFPAALRRRTQPGDTSTFNLSSLAFSTAGRPEGHRGRGAFGGDASLGSSRSTTPIGTRSVRRVRHGHGEPLTVPVGGTRAVT